MQSYEKGGATGSQAGRSAWAASVVLVAAVFQGQQAAAQSGGLFGTPIEIGAGLDMVLEAPLVDLRDTDFELRAFELNIGAPVDPYFHLIATIGYHEGEGDLEEAWVSAILPFNLKLQVGREMLPFGYLNRIHEHDFPQVDQPFVYEGLLTDHGMVGDGGHLEWLAPFINPTLTMNAGVYPSMGHSIGRRMGGVPFMLRAQSFVESGCGEHSALAGASYLGVLGDRDYAEGRESDRRARGKVQDIIAFDVKYRWGLLGQRTGRGLTLAGEYIYVDYDRNPDHEIYDPALGGDPGLDPGSDQGFYAYAHWDFDRFFGVGYRFDHSDVLFSKLEDEERKIGHSVYLEWWGTEFSRIRLQYQMAETRAGGEREIDHLVLLQGAYFIGWHPPHRF